MTEQQRWHFRAVRMLAGTTIFWSLSFPLVKAITILQSSLLPESSSWFHASLTGFVRFSVAGLVLLCMNFKTVRQLTRSEIWQGLGLGFFAGGGILLQMDALSYTSASTSAFLTQAYCVMVPLVVAFRDRILPGARLIAAIGLTILGVAVLANFNFETFRLGRGEAETLVCAVFFAGQILWLERPKFARNNAGHISMVMFLTIAAIAFPILAATSKSPRDVLVCYSNPGVLVMSASIILFCTVIAFVAMNRWQRYVPSTEAAIIYGAEPVFASALALFLPGLISRFTGIRYLNETLTWELIVGGILIIGANLLLQIRWARKTVPLPA